MEVLLKRVKSTGLSGPAATAEAKKRLQQSRASSKLAPTGGSKVARRAEPRGVPRAPPAGRLTRSIQRLADGIMPSYTSALYNVYNSLHPESDIPMPIVPTRFQNWNRRMAGVTGRTRASLTLGAGAVVFIIPVTHIGHDATPSASGQIVDVRTWTFNNTSITLSANAHATEDDLDTTGGYRTAYDVKPVTNTSCRARISGSQNGAYCFHGSKLRVSVSTPYNGLATVFAVDPNQNPIGYGFNYNHTSKLPTWSDSFPAHCFDIPEVIHDVQAWNSTFTCADFLQPFRCEVMGGNQTMNAVLVSAGDTEIHGMTGKLSTGAHPTAPPWDYTYETNGEIPQKSVHADLGMMRGCIGIINQSAVSMTYMIDSVADFSAPPTSTNIVMDRCPRLDSHNVPDMSSLTIGVIGRSFEECERELQARQYQALIDDLQIAKRESIPYLLADVGVRTSSQTAFVNSAALQENSESFYERLMAHVGDLPNHLRVAIKMANAVVSGFTRPDPREFAALL